MPKRKTGLNPLAVFLVIVAALVAVAMIIDWSTRSRMEVAQLPAARLAPEEMDHDQLLTAYSEIKIDALDARPSVLEDVGKRLNLARLLCAKSTPETAGADRERLLGALGLAYTIRRNNQLDHAAIREELRSVLALVKSDASLDQQQLARGMEFELFAHELLDKGDAAKIVPAMAALARSFRDQFPGREAATMLENPLLALTLSPAADAAFVDVLTAVSAAYADHSDPRLKQWSGKLADDAILLRLGLFPLYESIRRREYQAPRRFVEQLARFIPAELTDAGVTRIMQVVLDINELENREEARLGYQTIRDVIANRPDTEANRLNIADCERGLARLEALQKPVAFEVTDIRGRTLRLDDPEFMDHAFVVCVIGRGADFDSLCRDKITTEGVAAIESRNIHIVVHCPGLDAAQAEAELTSWSGANIFIVADPERTSPLGTACPVSQPPFIWLISRHHTLADFNLSPDELVVAVESLMYSRDGG